MKYLAWILKFALFVLVLMFAVRNTDMVTVHFYFGGEWQAPLIFALLVAFCAGAATGLGAGLGQIIRQRREIGILRRELSQTGVAQLARTEGS